MLRFSTSPSSGATDGPKGPIGCGSDACRARGCSCSPARTCHVECFLSVHRCVLAGVEFWVAFFTTLQLDLQIRCMPCVLVLPRTMRPRLDDFSVVRVSRFAFECVFAWCLMRCPRTRLGPDSNIYFIYRATLCYVHRKYEYTVQEHQLVASDKLLDSKKIGLTDNRTFPV